MSNSSSSDQITLSESSESSSSSNGSSELKRRNQQKSRNNVEITRQQKQNVKRKQSVSSSSQSQNSSSSNTNSDSSQSFQHSKRYKQQKAELISKQQTKIENELKSRHGTKEDILKRAKSRENEKSKSRPHLSREDERRHREASRNIQQNKISKEHKTKKDQPLSESESSSTSDSSSDSSRSERQASRHRAKQEAEKSRGLKVAAKSRQDPSPVRYENRESSDQYRDRGRRRSRDDGARDSRRKRERDIEDTDNHKGDKKLKSYTTAQNKHNDKNRKELNKHDSVKDHKLHKHDSLNRHDSYKVDRHQQRERLKDTDRRQSNRGREYNEGSRHKGEVKKLDKRVDSSRSDSSDSSISSEGQIKATTHQEQKQRIKGDRYKGEKDSVRAKEVYVSRDRNRWGAKSSESELEVGEVRDSPPARVREKSYREGKGRDSSDKHRGQKKDTRGDKREYKLQRQRDRISDSDSLEKRRDRQKFEKQEKLGDKYKSGDRFDEDRKATKDLKRDRPREYTSSESESESQIQRKLKKLEKLKKEQMKSIEKSNRKKSQQDTDNNENDNNGNYISDDIDDRKKHKKSQKEEHRRLKVKEEDSESDSDVKQRERHKEQKQNRKKSDKYKDDKYEKIKRPSDDQDEENYNEKHLQDKIKQEYVDKQSDRHYLDRQESGRRRDSIRSDDLDHRRSDRDQKFVKKEYENEKFRAHKQENIKEDPIDRYDSKDKYEKRRANRMSDDQDRRRSDHDQQLGLGKDYKRQGSRAERMKEEDMDVENNRRSDGRRSYDNRNNSNNVKRQISDKDKQVQPYRQGSGKAQDKSKDPKNQQPNFGLSGKLAEEANKVDGVVMQYQEPQDQAMPDKRWRLYVFVKDQMKNPIPLHRQSCYMFGRRLYPKQEIIDIPIDDQFSSKEQAAFQFRLTQVEDDLGLLKKAVRPYIMDLNSSNGTFLNKEKIQPARFYEVKEKDVISFAKRKAEYVVLFEELISD